MIIKKFEELVEKYPGRTALKAEGNELTYSELNRCANRLAVKIKDRDSITFPGKKKQIISLLFEHGTDMIVAVLAALKANSVYVPLDVAYPLNRLAYMLENSESYLMVTNTKNLFLAEKLKERAKGNIETINIDAVPTDTLAGNIERQVEADELAYILYTSGSTGRPKGVMQTQRNVLYFVDNLVKMCSISGKDRMTLLSAFSHDAAVMDIFGALLGGATLYPYNIKDKINTAEFPQWLIDEKITIWHSVPTVFRHFVGTLTGNKFFPDVRYILLGGERVRNHDLQVFKKFFPNSILANIYGQSESSINSIWFVDRPDKSQNVIIGAPFEGTELFIMNEDGEIIEDIGVGEIILAGEHLAPGYWQDVSNTEKSFLYDNEFGRIYRTGDSGRLNADGSIEFMGRIDTQIKIRGFRVELGEIETVLLKHGAIKEAVVLEKEVDKRNAVYDCMVENSDISLWAYIVSEKELRTADLKEFLAGELPGYMIPDNFVRIEKIPLTPTYKVDRKALLQIEVEDDEAFALPKSDLEKRLAEIWTEILQIDRESISIDTSFFRLGGHSLNANILTARIHKSFNVLLQVDDIFRAPTIKELSAYIKNASAVEYRSIMPFEKREYYPLSPAQKRLYVMQMMEKDSIGYNNPIFITLVGSLEKRKINSIFTEIVKKHESLRTSFRMIGEEPVQVVHEDINLEIEYYDLTAKNKKGYEEENVNAPSESINPHSSSIIHRFLHSFDLNRAPLLRVGLIKEVKNQYLLLIDMHHIIADGVSCNILTEEFMQLYAEGNSPPLKLQFKDYVEWQNKWAESEKLKQEERFWINQFAGDIPVLDMPTDFNRPKLQSFSGDIMRFHVENELQQKLSAIINETGSTLFIFLLTIFNILLYKYTGQDDIIIGTTISSRNHADLEDIVGLLWETLALRNFPTGEKTFNRFLFEIKDRVLEAYENQEYPFINLIKKVSAGNDLSRNPIFDMMIIIQNQGVVDVEIEGVRLVPYVFEYSKDSKVDLTLNAVESKEGIEIILNYCTDLFTRQTIERLFKHFIKITKAAVDIQDILIADIDFMTDKEKEEILEEFNDTHFEYPQDKSIIELFKDRVDRSPDHTAVVFKDIQSTYNDLHARADYLAGLLRKKGVIPEILVGILGERSLEMITGILGILKAGGAYLPIDPDYPGKRIEYMLIDSGIETLLTQKAFRKQAYIHGNSALTDIVEMDNGDIYPGESTNPGIINDIGNSAYLIYTSGSTGAPKGIIVEHKNVIAYLHAFLKEFALTSKSIMLQQASFLFDTFLEEVFPVLVKGGRLEIIEKKEVLDVEFLCGFIKRRDINIISTTPLLLNELNKGGNIDNVDIFISGGDILKKSYINNLAERGRVYNTYGPTETTVCATYYECLAGGNGDEILIGKPIANYQVYILDRDDCLLSPGITGEICIQGGGVARGYLNNPELTAEKFIRAKHIEQNSRQEPAGAAAGAVRGAPNDYAKRSGVLLYRTGDLGRWRAGGNIEFVGRKDNQVKIRGCRIELAEIESRLLDLAGVKDAVVTYRDENTGERLLCGYLVLDESNNRIDKEKEKLDIPGIRRQLSDYIPGYMIPQYLMPIDKIPLTANGKIDKRALPPPGIVINDEYTAPRNEFEEKLAGIWAEVLAVEKKKISIEANFFELGGHSLKAITLRSNIYKEFDVNVDYLDIFVFPTIKELTGLIIKKREENGKSPGGYFQVEPGEKKEFYDLSSAQRRLYSLQELTPDSTGYNITGILPLQITIDTRQLGKIFKRLICRHEALRTSFKRVDWTPVQVVHDELDFKVDYHELGREIGKEKAELENLIKTHTRPFILSEAPLMRTLLIKHENGIILMIDMHHIISDGISLDILHREFNSIYAGNEVPMLKLQYRDFSQLQHTPLYHEYLKRQESYWLQQFEGNIVRSDLAVDYPRNPVRTERGDRFYFSLDETLTSRLKKIVKDMKITFFVLFQGIYCILQSKLAKNEDIIFGTVFSGRKQPGFENTIGMMVNILPLRYFVDRDKEFIEFLNEVKSRSILAFENQEFSFDDMISKLGLKRDLSRNPLFDTVFVFHDYYLNEAEEKNEPGIVDQPAFPVVPIEDIKIPFDLIFAVTTIGKRINMHIAYSTGLFKLSTIEKIQKQFIAIINQVVENINIKINDISLLSGLLPASTTGFFEKESSGEFLF